MALSGWSTEDFLQRSTPAWPGQLPFGVSMWLYVPSTAGGVFANAFSLGQDGLQDHSRLVQVDDSDQLRVVSRATSTASAFLGPAPTDQWFHVAAYYVASNLRGGLVNGAGDAFTNAVRNVAAPDSTFIGIRANFTAPFYPNAAIGSVSVWNLEGFSAQDRVDWAQELASGANPGSMDGALGQPWGDALVDYASLNNTNSLGSYTEIGSLIVFDSHPPVAGEGGLFSVVLWETAGEAVPVVIAPMSVVLWEATVGTAAEAPVAHEIVGDVTITVTPEAVMNFTPEGAPTFSIIGDVTIRVIPNALFKPPTHSEIYTTYDAEGQREDLGWRHPIRRRDTLIIIEPEDDSIRRNLSPV